LAGRAPIASERASSAGPRTTPVLLSEYKITRYVSQERGSDSSGDGSMSRPWASPAHALVQIPDAGPKNRAAVLVAAGTYGGKTLTMKAHIDLFGGFESSRWTRNILKNRTTLDGEEQRRVIIGASDSRLDGFHIARGLVRGRGAAMMCERASPEISNNVFIKNRTLAPLPWNPKNIHELANDGGAVMCLDHASPRIEHNLFADNSTENGRGGALACHQHASPRIAENVFLKNVSGRGDPTRSSDGGALSAFLYSNPEILDNIVVGNRSLHSNDSGGIFVALWSSAVITGNIIVGNEGGDDGGALFIGGQEHRYDQPLDPVPSADQFRVKVSGNVIMGNWQGPQGKNSSGAMRVTMESRALIENNIIAENPGGLHLQRSELVLRNNTILDDLGYIEEKATVAPGILVNNILRGHVSIQNKATLDYCNVKGGFLGKGNFDADPGFVDDGVKGNVISRVADLGRFVTKLTVISARLKPHDLAGRAIRVGEEWSVVQDNAEGSITVWGSPGEKSPAESPMEFRVPPRYRLGHGSPCIDKGDNRSAPAIDFKGSPRPVHGGLSLTVDIGADEYGAAVQKAKKQPQTRQK